MLGDSSTAPDLATSSTDAPAAAAAAPAEDDRMKLSAGPDEFGDRSFGGNRWPRQETIALLKIRSDMDVTFRDASVKGPLWEEVSRKLAELGYQRSAKKCKEKFENVYKYHKRTKEGRTGKADGKTYRFFDQLTALENLPPTTAATFNPPPPLQPPPPHSQQPVLMASPISSSHQHQHQLQHPHQINATSSTTIPTSNNNNTVPSIPTNIAATTSGNVLFQSHPPPPPPQQNPINTAATLRDITGDLLSNSTSSSSSSSTDVDEEVAGGDASTTRRNKRKRKWKDFFERLMTEVIRRQEDLQKRFLDAVERREQERMAREESWRMHELSRINREREILSQERSVAAAKDAAVMSFLQKFSEHPPPSAATAAAAAANIISSLTAQPPPPPSVAVVAPVPASTPPAPIPVIPSAPPRTKPPPPPTPLPPPTQQGMTIVRSAAAEEEEGGGGGLASSSRWPKTEVHDLIKLRTSLEMKYQENGPKGPLWEEISAAMRRMGYNRSAKRCKEKWENINKYFKKVKESNKRRPEDSKTCPYYNLLEAIYREKMIRTTTTSTAPGTGAASEINAVPLMVQPEQQWPPLVPPPQASSAAAGDQSGQPSHPSEEEEEEEDDLEDEEGLEDEDDEDDDGGNNYELVASNKTNSVGAAES